MRYIERMEIFNTQPDCGCNLWSAVQIAETAGCPYDKIVIVANRLRLKPALALDGRRYFDADAVSRILDELQEGGR